MSKKNKDMPAMPVVTSSGICANGLTKREMIAKDLMSGILSNPDYSYEGAKAITKLAVGLADALLAELDK